MLIGNELAGLTAGIDALYRSNAAQRWVFRQGRPDPGRHG